MSRHARPSAGRSNMYSESKCSNWMRYDPQQSELNALRNAAPTATFALADDSKLALIELPLHTRFVRPFNCDDIIQILKMIPPDMLIGLRQIALLGGTSRQERSAWSSTWCYGCYGSGNITLFAFPERRRIWKAPNLHKPAEILTYRRAGVEITHEDGEWVYRFTDESLKRFYLWDVLVHEIGHHVDRFHPDCSRARSERFAEWFARTYGFEAKHSGTPNPAM